MNKKIFFLLLAVGSMVFSCGRFTFNDTKGAELVASLDNEKLYMRDVVGLNAPDLTEEDSIDIIKNYSEYWLRSRVVAKYSQRRYSANSEEIEKLIEEYKRSLFTEFFEKEYTKGLSDFIGSDEIDAYYNENKQKFALSSSIVKAQIMTIPKNYVDAALLKKKFASASRDDFEDIVSIAERDKLIVKDFSQSWVYFNEIIGHIPFTGDATDFLKNEKMYETSDNNFKYTLKIIECKLKGEISPKEVVVDLIKRAIIIERRKNRIQQVRDSIYNDAILSGDAVIKNTKN